MADAAKIKETTANSNAANKRVVRALVIGGRKEDSATIETLKAQAAEPGRSKELPEDPFQAMTLDGRLIEPPFDMMTLAMLKEHSTELGQCIESMVINCESFGYRFIPRVKLDEPQADDALKTAVKRERVRLENFFAYASLKDSFTKLRRKKREDLEATGNAYWEVIRNAAGQIQGLNHLPAYQTRLSTLEEDQLELKVPILELQVDGSVKIEHITTWARFRRFAQSKTISMGRLTAVGSYKVRWFKEFGDPRVYDNRTGEVVTDPKKLKELPEVHRANEVIHFTLYSTRSPYGLPRYIGNLLSIFGDRASEEINFTTFQNNAIPSMVVLVSNGQITQGSIDRITEFTESAIMGSDNYSKFLILEAESEDIEDGEDASQVKLDIRPLVKEQHKDALFQNYSENNQDKIRRAWRLPPIFVGRSDDYTRATAETSRRLADEQVFNPERDDFDDFVNLRIFPAMGIIYHKFKSNSPNTTDNTELVKLISGGEKTGGMSPRIARKLLEDIFGQELPEFPEDFPADVAFSLTMAEAVKNKADPAEPGQQVTALKAIEMLTGGEVGESNVDEFLVEHAAKLNTYFEKRWREMAAEAAE
jgi:PBSX family phage portal protein